MRFPLVVCGKLSSLCILALSVACELPKHENNYKKKLFNFEFTKKNVFYPQKHLIVLETKANTLTKIN